MDAAAFRKLDQRLHVLQRPGMYIGSTVPETGTFWVLAGQEDAEGASAPRRMEAREGMRYVPGLHKIVDEIVVNAVDHSVRMARRNLAGGGTKKRGRTLGITGGSGGPPDGAAEAAAGEPAVRPVRKIAVAIDASTGVIEVTNDGDGLPVEMHEEHGCYVPELIFGHLLTGSNFDDADEESRTVGGQNGIGAKACNIFSRWFEVETVDRVRKKLYTQRWEDNMETARPPVIKAYSKVPYTTVRFLPDYARFGMPDGMDADTLAVMQRRVVDLVAVTDPDVSVWLDGERIAQKTFAAYVDLYLGTRGEAGRVHERIEDAGWEVAVGLSDGSGMQQVSFVNGVSTIRGGRHVDHIVQQLCKRVGDAMAASRGKNVAAVKPHFIRDNLFVFVRATVPNPTFDSQSKETLTTPASKFGVRVELSDKFVQKVAKLDGLLERVASLSDAAVNKAAAKTDGAKRATVTGLPKLDDAEWAGTAKSSQCTLILTEGDSAKASAVAGLAVVGRQRYGVYPLRGKIMNVCDVSADRVAGNAEITALKKILALQTGRVYTSAAELRYGRVLIMTDADHDGSHIRGLLFYLFYRQWPSLLQLDGFFASLLTPVVKAFNLRTKEELAFYSACDYAEWAEGQNGGGGGKGGDWRCKYYKGLGTSTAAEAREWFKKMRIAVYTWDEDTSADALSLGFDKKRADERKGWLSGYERANTLDYSASHDVGYADFVHRELIHFSQYDVQRSIPSAIDGLKVSQRKAMFGCFKRNLTDEVRVAQLAAYVSEHAAHHHGEASMQSTIIGMAQDFVGSNNLPVLRPVGQFGSRLAGGSDSASPRYIYTVLAPAARALLPKADDAVLTYLQDDSISVEPEHYLPVLPLLLINGALGIGTGFSTSIPCFSPLDVAAQVRRLLDAEPGEEGQVELEPLAPWFRGFRGTIEPAATGTRFVSRGKAELCGPAKVRITELPVGTWTDDFKALLQAAVEKHPDIKGFTNSSSEAAVDFTLTFASAAAAQAWMAPLPEAQQRSTQAAASSAHVTRLEEELKLVSGKGLSMTNMHAFDAAGRIRRFETTADVIREFYTARLAGYERRKAHLLEQMCHSALLLSQRVSFVTAVVDGSLQLHRRATGDDLDREMEGLGLVKMEGSFRYLTSMAMASMTTDRVAALKQELASVHAAVDALTAKHVKQLWREDLDVLQALLKQELKQ